MKLQIFQIFIQICLTTGLSQHLHSRQILFLVVFPLFHVMFTASYKLWKHPAFFFHKLILYLPSDPLEDYKILF